MDGVSEVGGRHVGVGPDHRRCALRDDLAEVEDDETVAHRHHQVHVVLHQEHRHAIGEPADPRSQRVHLALGEPARRLVEQQELRLRHEGAGQRGPLLNCVGERGGHPAGVVRGTELVEHGHGPRRHAALLAAGAPDAEEGRSEVAAQGRFGAEHHVLVHGQARTEADPLQGARDAQLGQVVRMVPAQDGTAVGDRSRAGMDETADHVEERRLARSVRPDDPDHLAVARPTSTPRRGPAGRRTRR